MKLFHSPGSCSDGVALLLCEAGAPFEVVPTIVQERAQRRAEYLALNPKGKVPALERPDGTVLTEFPAIAFWIARRFPDAGLLAAGLEAEVRAIELLDFIVASIHMRGMTFLKVPQKFLADPKGQSELRAFGRSEAQSGLALLAEVLGEQEYLQGRFGVADAAAFYVLNWALDERLDIAPRLVALHARIHDRPTARRLAHLA